MSGFRIEGNSSGNVAEVDNNNNINVTLPVIPNLAGVIQLAGKLAASTDPAGLLIELIGMSSQNRLMVGQVLPLLNEFFNNTTLNSALFQAPVTTQTVTCAGGTLNLNASAITTLSTVSRVSTYQFFPFFADMSTYCVFDALLTAAPQANAVIEMGFGIATASSTPTDGAFFRYDSTGVLKAVVNTNGSEITSASLTVPSAAVLHRHKIIVEDDRALFYIDGVCVSIVPTPTAVGFPVSSPAQPWFARVYHLGIAPTLANVLKIGYVYVAQEDAAGLGKDNATVAAQAGRMGHQGQSGQTIGSTALLTNNLAPGVGAAMTNTTAALGSGLGGQFTTQPTLAANTDGIVSSFQVPAAAAAVPGKTLYIKGVRVQSVVSAALTGGPVVYEYSLAFGHTAVSLATAEAVQAKAPRRVGIGIESIAATAAAGVVGSASGQVMQFLSPIAVNPGEFVQVVAKNIGTVTSAGTITFLVSFDCYWE